ncbi:hypothetical protein [Anaerosacchariphilus polymeriproducens]|uniref:Uncharacterized protein n=1 Tax=Anaerosacchariphilus polymeriproducens TaxID=1812858 RepID=A0A371B0E8_9FIRM|nr:hypothetical protein [Anaerosacchariphilus polymeriproducens]RDU25279.1 hypothetical protein DWV06_00130 [Anaerosacchariphilus polymeriproducens]
MNKELMDIIIEKRKLKHNEDDFGIQECWDEIVVNLSESCEETIKYLEECSEEYIYYISEVFEDISEQLQRQEFIECLRKLEKKFPNLNLKKDIDIAEEYI